MNLNNLSEDEKLCLAVNIAGGYQLGYFEAGIQVLLDSLLGYPVDPIPKCYLDLLDLYYKAGGGPSFQNKTGMVLSGKDYVTMVRLDTYRGIETYLNQKYGPGLSVECEPFNLYVIK